MGQQHLMQTWATSFRRYGKHVGQVLLTASDAGVRHRARNAQRTIDRLLYLGVVPIVNENDTVAHTEMRFGDNDRLAALVAHLSCVDALVLLSDVDGLYDRNPSDPAARFVPEVRDGNDLKSVVAGDGGEVGTGGMASKVTAARIASRGGVPVLLTSADNIAAALDDALPSRGAPALDARAEFEAPPPGVEDRPSGSARVLHAHHRDAGIGCRVERPLDPIQAVAQAREADAQREPGVLALHVDEDQRSARIGPRASSRFVPRSGHGASEAAARIGAVIRCLIQGARGLQRPPVAHMLFFDGFTPRRRRHIDVASASAAHTWEVICGSPSTHSTASPCSTCRSPRWSSAP